MPHCVQRVVLHVVRSWFEPKPKTQAASYWNTSTGLSTGTTQHALGYHC